MLSLNVVFIVITSTPAKPGKGGEELFGPCGMPCSSQLSLREREDQEEGYYHNIYNIAENKCPQQ